MDPRWSDCQRLLPVLAKTEVETPEGRQTRSRLSSFDRKYEVSVSSNPRSRKWGFAHRCRRTRVHRYGSPRRERSGRSRQGPQNRSLGSRLPTATFGAGCASGGEECLRRTIEHVRRQVNRPTDWRVRTDSENLPYAAPSYAMDSTAALVVNAFDNGEEDIMFESALLKVFTSDETLDHH